MRDEDEWDEYEPEDPDDPTDEYPYNRHRCHHTIKASPIR